MLENLDKIMHLRFNFDACPVHSPLGFVHLTHQNLSARALFCVNSLAKVNMQILMYKYSSRLLMVQDHMDHKWRPKSHKSQTSLSCKYNNVVFALWSFCRRCHFMFKFLWFFYSLFARFRHLRGKPQSGSNMNENVT